MIPQKLSYRETTDEKIQRGLETLAKDVTNWVNRTQTNQEGKPTTGVTYDFVPVIKIAILIVVISITIRVLLNPEFILEGFSWVKHFFHSF